jgi:hypothetical protein
MAMNNREISSPNDPGVMGSTENWNKEIPRRIILKGRKTDRNVWNSSNAHFNFTDVHVDEIPPNEYVNRFIMSCLIVALGIQCVAFWKRVE